MDDKSAGSSASLANGNLNSIPETKMNHVPKLRSYVSAIILLVINLINYMDRYSIAAVLTDIQKFYDISDTWGGLLQTAFICTFMIFAPIFGYFGDRLSRKLLMIAGIGIWSGSVMGSTFVDSKHFWIFILLRAITGIGEASYVTVAPTIIADLFHGVSRSRMLMTFYFAIPVGSGLGYVVGGGLASLLGSWQWGLRFTPIIGAGMMIIIALFLPEPVRGQIEHDGPKMKATSFKDDLIGILKVKTFVFCTIAQIFLTFTSGALAWWLPSFAFYALSAGKDNQADKGQLNLIFGACTLVGGLVGVSFGTHLATVWQRKVNNKRPDPWVCALGLLLCGPLIYFGITIMRVQTTLSWFITFLAVATLSMNWGINSDMIMYTILPTRRASANAIQILLAHLLGDASSPYIIGQISEVLQKEDSDFNHYLSLLDAMYMMPFIVVLGGFAYLLASFYVEEDRQNLIISMRIATGKIPLSSKSNLGEVVQLANGMLNDLNHVNINSNSTIALVKPSVLSENNDCIITQF